MPLIAGQLIRSARDLHPLFTEEATPGMVALRFLSAFHRTLFGAAVLANERVGLAELTIDLPLADFAAGTAMPAHQRVHPVGRVIFDDGDATELTMISPADRDRDRLPRFAAFLEGSTVHLVRDEADWTGVDTVVVRYVAVAAALTAATDTLLLPDEAEEAVLQALAALMAGRAEGVDARGFKRDAEVARAEFLDQLERKDAAVVSRTREVW